MGSVAQRERCPPGGLDRAEIAADGGSMHFYIILITYYCTSVGLANSNYFLSHLATVGISSPLLQRLWAP